MLNQENILVRIQLLRIQTFLFALPRLKPMLGANALLGKVIRYELPKLAGYRPAKQAGPASDSADPLEKALAQLATNRDAFIINRRRDDPEGLRKSGILTRDGGHFQAVFASHERAEAFWERAAALLTRQLPGLRFEIELYCLDSGKHLGNPAVMTTSLAELPHFRVCEETGIEPASLIDPTSQKAISLKADALKRAGYFFQHDKRHQDDHRLPGYDIVSLLQNQFPGYGVKPYPEDLEQLAGPSGYIAVIHADGNSIGERRRLWMAGKDQTDFIQYETENETFFHAMRCTVRAGLVAALHDTFAGHLDGVRYLPYQVLMLGGDDLVLVCQARFALDFVRHYARQLQTRPIPWQNNETRPISMGAGVVIARYSIPFHRLHALAEQLAGSAKRLYRRQPQDAQGARPERSVVDWLTTTASWVDSPEADRQRHQWVRYSVAGTAETLALSGKPYFVLPSAASAEPVLDTLAGLLDASHKLQPAKTAAESGNPQQLPLARSQLKDLAQALHQGRGYARMRFRNLPQALRDTLKEPAHGGLTVETLFQEDPVRKNHYLTRFLDLLEIMEIGHLGRKDADKDAEPNQP